MVLKLHLRMIRPLFSCIISFTFRDVSLVYIKESMYMSLQIFETSIKQKYELHFVFFRDRSESKCKIKWKNCKKNIFHYTQLIYFTPIIILQRYLDITISQKEPYILVIIQKVFRYHLRVLPHRINVREVVYGLWQVITLTWILKYRMRYITKN